MSESTTNGNNQKNSRIHIYEIDLIRAITVFSVVAIHSLSYTSFLTTDKIGAQLVNLIIHALHYNREMFMFVTGLVLTFVYYNKPFSPKKFWLKRFSLVLIPYIVWSVIYVVINNSSLSFISYVKLSLWDIVTGDASFQLYYILLSLQFYAVFPLFLVFLKKVAHRPWITLAISFALQLFVIYIDFTYLQAGPLYRIKIVNMFVQYQDRIFLIYQFFFVLGSFAAMYMDATRRFLKKYGWYIPLGVIASLIGYTMYYYAQLNQFHLSMNLATSVLQPSVVLYSTVIIVFFAWVALHWEKRRKGYKLIKIISDTSFGIYFVHVLVLSLISQDLLPHVSAAIPLVVKDSGVILLAFTVSVAFCYIILKIPLLSWTIGKAQPLRKV